MPAIQTDQPPGTSADHAVAKPEKRARRVDRKRRWWLPRFRLIDLIWLSLIAAILMSWQRDRERLLEEAEILKSQQLRTSAWSIKQVLGAPDTPQPGDQSTAWASMSQDASREWIIVEFPMAVEIKQVVVYETYNPGAVDRICTVNFMHDETEIWKGTDPTPTTSQLGRSLFKIKPGVQSRRLKIFLNSGAVRGWNEIDAVALYGTDGSVQWASNAWASSAYGENQALPKWFWP